MFCLFDTRMIVDEELEEWILQHCWILGPLPMRQLRENLKNVRSGESDVEIK